MTSSDSIESWSDKIKPLADRAFELAVARWERDAPLDEAAIAEARQKQAELRGLAKELKENHPHIYKRFSDLISEALLDYKYALNAPPATSLRLHHYIEDHERKS